MSRDEAQKMLNAGDHPQETVRAFSSLANGSANAGLVAEYSLSLAAAGMIEASLEEMDRAFLLDSTDDEVLFAGSTLLAFIGVTDAAREIARPAPSWATRTPLLPPRGGLGKRWDELTPARDLGSGVAEASALMEKSRYITATDRLAHLVGAYPREALAWSGYAIALENIGAYRSAARAVAAEIALTRNSATPETLALLEEHKANLESRPPLTRPKPNEALKGLYTAFAGMSLSGGNGASTTFTLNAQAGKFVTNHLNLSANIGYSTNTKFLLGTGARYHFPLDAIPLNFTAGTLIAYESGSSSGKVGWLLSPGLSLFAYTGSLDLYVDIGIVGAQQGTATITLGYTMYFGRPE